MAISEQLKNRREALGVSQSVVADRAGLNLDTVSRLENGSNARLDTVSAVERALDEIEAERGADTGGDLVRQTRTGVLDDAEPYDRDITRGYKKHDVPLIGDAEASSNGFIAWDDEGMVSAQVERWYSRAFSDGDLRAVAFRVRGDSMVPRLRPGEIVIAQPSVTARDGDDAIVVLQSGERLIKRVFRKSGAWVLHSENPVYPDREELDEAIVGVYPIKHTIRP